MKQLELNSSVVRWSNADGVTTMTFLLVYVRKVIALFIGEGTELVRREAEYGSALVGYKLLCTLMLGMLIVKVKFKEGALRFRHALRKAGQGAFMERLCENNVEGSAAYGSAAARKRSPRADTQLQCGGAHRRGQVDPLRSPHGALWRH